MLDCRAAVVYCQSTESPTILLHASSPARQLLTSLKGHWICTIEAGFVLLWPVESLQLFCCSTVSAVSPVKWMWTCFKYSYRFWLILAFSNAKWCSLWWSLNEHNIQLFWKSLEYFIYIFYIHISTWLGFIIKFCIWNSSCGEMITSQHSNIGVCIDTVDILAIIWICFKW